MRRLGRMVLIGLVSCAAAQGCGDESTPDARGAAGGTRNPCGTPVSTSIAWEEATSLDVTAREAFSTVAGSCTAPLTWDASGSDLSIEPLSGETQVEVRVELDEQSARLVEPQRLGGTLACAVTLELDAQVHIESADGTFADRSDVTLRYTKEGGVAAFGFQRALAELGGSLRITAQSKQAVSLQYRSSGAGNVCAGEIGLSVTEQTESGGSGSVGTIGAWSNTGCPLGSEAVPLDGSSELGAAITREIAHAWSDASYPGVWDDDTNANLTLSVEVNAERACAATTGARMVQIPVRLTYGTDDERIRMHSTDSYVMAWPDADDGVNQLQLTISESMVCENRADVLAYTREDCRALSSALVQLSLNQYANRAAGADGSALEVYEYALGATMDGAANNVARLSLSAPVP